MKKNTLIKSAIALAVVGATTATTIADTKLYGRFRAGIVCNDAGNGTDTDCGLENRSSRFGIKSNQEITDGLTAFGRYEFEVRLDEGSIRAKDDVNNAARRLAYVGLKGGFGEISVGSRWTPMYNYIGSPVDPTQLLGGNWEKYGAMNLTGFRKADTVNYKNKFGPGSVHVMLQMDDGDVGSDAIDEYQIGGGFKLGTINLGLAYRDVTDGNSTIGVHAGTKLGAINLGLSFLNEDIAGAGDNQALQALLGYGLGGGKNINVSYGQLDLDSGTTPYTLAVEYEHKLSKNYRWFADISTSDDDVAGTDNLLRYGTGMRLEF